MTSRTDAPWWRDAVIYQIYPRSFADADGDGIGDLPGIRRRLAHIATLGADAVWLSPFYTTPQKDAGYDVSDYRDVDPVFGTLADATAMIEDAHGLGLRVIIDIVPNHTSDQHALFKEALAAAPGSAERDRYIFRDGRGPAGDEPPSDWLSVFGGPAWQRVPDGQWYLHLFTPEQPDLNWHNADVHAEFASTLRFWLDRGVDGFRIDVAHGLFKDLTFPDMGDKAEGVLEPTSRLNHPFWDRDEVLGVYEEWRQILDTYDGDRMLVAEAWVANPVQLARYVAPGRLHTAFNFDFLKCPWRANLLRSVIDGCLDAGRAVQAPTTWVLSNHDVVRHVTRYGRAQPLAPASRAAEATPDPVGLDALDGLDLDLGRRRARAATVFMLALPGGAYIYQGEELGLEEVEDLPDEVLADPIWERSGHQHRGRDGARVPLPWAGTAPPFAFGPEGSTPWLPQPDAWASRTAAAQEGDEGSSLELYRTALRLRREHPALGDGDLRWLTTPEDVLGFVREPGFACFVNFRSSPVPGPEAGRPLLASAPLDASGAIPAEAAVWYDLGAT